MVAAACSEEVCCDVQLAVAAASVPSAAVRGRKMQEARAVSPKMTVVVGGFVRVTSLYLPACRLASPHVT